MRLAEALRPGPEHRARRLYDAAPRRIRAHLWLRWATCPFDAVAQVVPTSGHVLEVGCGHGSFANYLALSRLTRDVVGIDVDERKIRHSLTAAERARAHGAKVAFSLTAPGRIPPGPWDCILIIDVLYLLEPDRQRALLRDCASLLAPGGVLVVKEMGCHPRWKLAWNVLQETVSVRLLRITRGGRVFLLPPDRYADWMARDGLRVSQESLHRGYPHPHHLLVGHRV